MKNNLIYYIMTYVMYLYPPFIYGMIVINVDRISDTRTWILGGIINIIFVLVTTAVLYLLSKYKKIPLIQKDEKNHFIFGYIGNVIVFLYVYQYVMDIERVVSVFSLVLILVIAYKYLIAKKIIFKEIFYMSIIYSVIDYIIIITTGNTLFNDMGRYTETQSNIFQLLFIAAILYALVLYVYKLYRNHHYALLRYIFLSFVILTILMVYIDDNLEELIMTLLIITLFTWVIDIILRLVHKEFRIIDFVFYARVLMAAIVLVIIKEMELYTLPDFNLGQMFLLIAIFYVSCFSDIVMQLAPKDKNLDLEYTIEDYLKQVYKPFITRYKDVIIYSSEALETYKFNKLGRDIILKHDIEDLKHLDQDSVSLIIVYVEDDKDIEKVMALDLSIKITIMSHKQLRHEKIKTSFTDYNYYVYTI